MIARSQRDKLFFRPVLVPAPSGADLLDDASPSELEKTGPLKSPGPSPDADADHAVG